jgi:hypothetical protein
MDSFDGPAHEGVVHTTYDEERDTSLACTVVDAVAAVTDAAPTELAPLYTAADPDALERLVSSLGQSVPQAGEGRTEFHYEGCLVAVTSSGAVTVRRHPQDGPGSVSTDAEFQAALARLVREAEADGVGVEGGWACRDDSPFSEWGIEIYEVERSNRRQ